MRPDTLEYCSKTFRMNKLRQRTSRLDTGWRWSWWITTGRRARRGCSHMM